MYVCVYAHVCMYVKYLCMHTHSTIHTHAGQAGHKRSRENSKTFFPHTMISIVITSSILFNLYVDYEVEIGKPALKIEARNCEPTGNERHAEIIYPYPHT